MKQTGNGKVWLLLLFLTAFPILYSLCLPQDLLTGQMEANCYPAFAQHFALLWLSQACLGGALLLPSGKLAGRDWLIALGIGLVSSGITIPLLPSGVLNGIAAGLAYLAVQRLNGEEEYPYFLQPGAKKRWQNAGIVASCTLGFLLLRYLTVSRTGACIRWELGWEPVVRGLAAGVSEELIFRMLLLAVAARLAGESPSGFAAVLLMTVPFAMYHAVEPLAYREIASAAGIFFSVLVRALLLVVLLKKRDCVTAMLVHAGYDIAIGIIGI